MPPPPKPKVKSKTYIRTNRYKFQSIHEILKNINVNVTHRVGLIEIEPKEQGGCFLNQQLREWWELNQTIHYKTFNHDVLPLCQTLPLLLYNKDEIIRRTLLHLQIIDSLALKPITDCISTLARDLRGDFYPYFSSFFKAYIDLLPNIRQKPEELEAVFTSLGYLMKYLRPYIVADFGTFFQQVSLTILSNPLSYVRIFCAESLSFIIRKLPSNDRCHHIVTLLEPLTDPGVNEHRIDGVACVLFESMKGVQGRLWSQFTSVLQPFIRYLGEQGPDSPLVILGSNLIVKLLAFVENEKEMTPILDVIYEQLTDWETTEKSSMSGILKMIYQCISYRHGSLISDKDHTMAVLLSSATRICNDGCAMYWLCLALTTLSHTSEPFYTSSAALLFTFTQFPTIVLFDFVMPLLSTRSPSIVAAALAYCELVMQSQPTVDHQDSILRFLSEISTIYIHDWDIKRMNGNWSPFPRLSFPLKHTLARVCSVLSSFNPMLMDDSIPRVLASLDILSIVSITSSSSSSSIQQSLINIANACYSASQASERQDRKEKLLFVLTRACRCYSFLKYSFDKSYNQTQFQIQVHEFLSIHQSLLSSYRQSFLFKYLLSAMRFLLEAVLKGSPRGMDMNTLFEYLHAASHECRLESIRILEFLIPSLLNGVVDVQSDSQSLSPLVACRDIELSELTVDTSRVISHRIRKLGEFAILHQQHSLYFDIIFNYLLGLYHIKFSYLWPVVTETIVMIVERCSNLEQFWKWYLPFFIDCENQSTIVSVTDGSVPNHDNTMPSPSNNVVNRGDIDDDDDDDEDIDGINNDDDDNPSNYKGSKKLKPNMSLKGSNASSSLTSLHNRMQQLITPDASTSVLKLHYLLWTLLGALRPVGIEKKSIEWIPFFLKFINHEYFPNFGKISVDDEGSVKVEQSGGCGKGFRKRLKEKLRTYLSMLQHTRASKRLYQSRDLYEIFLCIASTADSALQSLAVDCLVCWSKEVLSSYKDQLLAIAKGTTMRETLTLFSLKSDGGAILSKHRQQVVTVIIRLLYGKLSIRNSRASKHDSLTSRRAVVLGSVITLDPEEIAMFMNLVIRPLHEDAISWKKQIGFLTLLDEFLKRIRNFVIPFITEFFGLVSRFSCLATTYEMRGRVADGVSDGDSGYGIDRTSRDAIDARHVKTLCIQRAINMLEEYEDEAWCPALLSLMDTLRSDLIALSDEAAPYRVILLSLLKILSNGSLKLFSIIRYHDEGGRQTLGRVVHCLSSHLLTVSEGAIDVINNVYDHDNLLLQPYINDIITRLRDAMKGQHSDSFASTTHLARLLTILSRISMLATDGTQAASVIDVVIPFLLKKGGVWTTVMYRSGSSAADVVTVIRNMLKLVVNPSVYASSLSQLLSCSRTSLKARAIVCQCFIFIGESYPEYRQVSTILADLSAISSETIGDLDYKRNQAAFTLVNESLHKTLTASQLLPIIHSYFWALELDDISLRNSASYGLQSIVRFVASLTVPDAALIDLTTGLIFTKMKALVNHRNSFIRQEVLAIVSSFASSMSQVYPFYACLASENDKEIDFYYNVVHIQFHRRVRALQRLSKMCQTQAQSQSLTITNDLFYFFVPLVTQYIFDPNKESHNVVDAAVGCLGEMSKCLAWRHYHKVLLKFLRLLPRKEDFQRVLIRVIGTIIDNFHFDLKCTVETDQVEEKHDAEIDIDDVNDNDRKDDANTESNISINLSNPSSHSPVDSKTIYDSLINKILPELFKMMDGQAQGGNVKDHANVIHGEADEAQLKRNRMFNLGKINIALAIVKLLLLLPQSIRDIQLPHILITLSNSLKSRDDSIRNEARRTLVEIVQSLGPECLKAVLGHLQTALNRGYMVHVLGYTVHALLVGISESIEVGRLDGCLDAVMNAVICDLFGKVAEEKDVASIASQMKETKTSKSLDSIELIAKNVSCRLGLRTMINTVHVILGGSSTDVVTDSSGDISRKDVLIVEDMLRRWSVGLFANSTLQSSMLCEEIMLLLNAYFVAERRVDIDAIKSGGVAPETTTTSPLGSNTSVVIIFTLGLLLGGLKRGMFDDSTAQLDIFIETLTLCLKSRMNRIRELSLRCLCFIMHSNDTVQLGSLKKSLPVIVKHIFNLMERVGSMANEDSLVHACFKALITVMRDIDYFTFTTDQIVALVSIAMQDLEHAERQSGSFGLLKIVLNKKIIIKQLLDVMDRIRELSVTSQRDVVRKHCSELLLQYLLYFPLGQSRRDEILVFLINNTTYMYEDGRATVLELLNVLSISLPVEVMTEKLEMFYLPTVLVIMNDESIKCRKLAAIIIQSLYKRNFNIKKMESIALSWYHDNIKLRIAAVQIFGIFYENGSCSDAFQRRSQQDLMTVIGDATREGSLITEWGEAQWPLVYQSLISLEKAILNQLTTHISESFVWRSTSMLHRHSHSWIRSAASRVIGAWIAMKPQLSSDISVFPTVRHICFALNSAHLEVSLTDQYVKNLVALAPSLTSPATSSTIDNDERDDDEEAQEGHDNDVSSSQLSWLFRKLQFYGRREGQLSLRRASLMCLAALATTLPVSVVVAHLVYIIAPLYRITGGESTGSAEQTELKPLAEEMISVIESTVGSSLFFEAYNKVRIAAGEIRRQRKATRSLATAIRPDLAQQRRGKRKVQKQNKKKSQRGVGEGDGANVRGIKRHRIH